MLLSGKIHVIVNGVAKLCFLSICDVSSVRNFFKKILTTDEKHVKLIFVVKKQRVNNCSLKTESNNLNRCQESEARGQMTEGRRRF